MFGNGVTSDDCKEKVKQPRKKPKAVAVALVELKVTRLETTRTEERICCYAVVTVFFISSFCCDVL